MTIKQKLIASTAIWIPLMTGACSDSSLRIATHVPTPNNDNPLSCVGTLLDMGRRPINPR